MSNLRNELSLVAFKHDITRSADQIRLEMCKFIENIKSLIEKLADKTKRLEHTVSYLQATSNEKASYYASPNAAAVRTRPSSVQKSGQDQTELPSIEVTN